MFETRIEIIKPNVITRYRILNNGKSISFSFVLFLWQTNGIFRTFFTKLLAESPFTAFRWETPPLTLATKDQEFQFVLHNEPAFSDRKTDLNPFKSKFTDKNKDLDVISFANLGGDSTMVIPAPRTDDSAYGHLAAFLRNAPCNQIDAFWRVSGEIAEQKINTTPLWISTAGGGVAWLHLRIDSRPKYYGYLPYKNIA